MYLSEMANVCVGVAREKLGPTRLLSVPCREIRDNKNTNKGPRSWTTPAPAQRRVEAGFGGSDTSHQGRASHG